MRERAVRRALERVQLPAEGAAAERVWETVRAAHETRDRLRWSRRRRRPVAVLVAAGVLVIAALTPPGQAVVDRVRDVVGRTPSEPALIRLPGPGRLLVVSPSGPWVVQQDGSKRLLGDYDGASWSPRGLFVVATRGRQLVALEPNGDVRWTVTRPGVVTQARWAPSGFRIAYREGRTLRVVAGDGTADRVLARGVSPLASAWRPGAGNVLAYADASGRIHVVDVDTGRELWLSVATPGIRSLAWDGGQLMVRSGAGRIEVYSGMGAPRVNGPGAARGVELAKVVPARPGHVVVSAAYGPYLRIGLDPGMSLLYVDYDRAKDRSLLLLDPGRGPTQALFRGAGRFGEVVLSPDRAWALLSWPAANQWVFLALPTYPARPATEVGKVVAVSSIASEFAPGGSGRQPFPRVTGWAPPSP